MIIKVMIDQGYLPGRLRHLGLGTLNGVGYETDGERAKTAKNRETKLNIKMSILKINTSEV